MTTTDFSAGPQLPPAQTRVLRRSATNRVGAGVAGGLGAYFGVDPVLFRVLFAVAAFFGGAGVLAYLLAWAVIPEEGTERAAVDSWIGELRRRRVPVWAVAVAAGLLLWLVSFSWWLPAPAFPVVAVIALVVFLAVRSGRGGHCAPAAPTASAAPAASSAPTVSLSKDQPTAAAESGGSESGGSESGGSESGGSESGGSEWRGSEWRGSEWRGSEWRGSEWRGEGRAWVAEARAASRERRRRAWPVRVTTVLSVIAALVIIGIVDAVSRVPMSTYFWTAAAISGAGLLVGLVTRRTPWSLLPLAVLAVVGGLALSPTSASFWDGLGQRTWQPATLHSPYRLAVGQAVLDLSKLSPGQAGKTVDVTLGVGQVQVLVPRTMPVIVNAHVHIGAVTSNDGHILASGVGVDRTVTSTGAGRPVTVDVHLTDGNVDVRRD